MMTIEVKNVSKTIRRQSVIEHVSLSMRSGNIYGFQGINGSGKTMLMRLIAGLIVPTEGSISINEKVLGQEITFPERMGLFLEHPAFLDRYSGFDNLKMLSSIQNRITEPQIRRALELVGLNPADKKHYRKFSLGMKQRLGIAAAMMEQPDLLLLDEPTNALDTDGIASVKKILSAERARGALILISCHDFSLLREMSDEIFILETGQIRQHLYAPDFH